jgi:hypothetical protein
VEAGLVAPDHMAARPEGEDDLGGRAAEGDDARALGRGRKGERPQAGREEEET